VLAAVSEVVKSHEGKDTEAEYFGALMSVLESAEDEKSAAAISYLLGLLIPRLAVLFMSHTLSVTCTSGQRSSGSFTVEVWHILQDTDRPAGTAWDYCLHCSPQITDV
jgi:hypothetical protein